jgi:Tfp pilus assembly protein PilW
MKGEEMLELAIRRQPPAWRRTTHVPIHRMDRSNGFSLVELMIVAGLTAVVLAGLGALTLVSDVKVGRRTNSVQEAQEEWGRAVTFIQNEVANANQHLGYLECWSSLSLQRRRQANVWHAGAQQRCN